jgi:uncharacterized membrane protein
MVALLEGAGVRESFAASVAAFRGSVLAFLVFGAAALVLLGFALATAGILLPVVLPLWAAASYAAWKDLTGATARGGAITP